MKKTARLIDIPQDKEAVIKRITSKGIIRRRLLDVGFRVGSVVTPLFSDPCKSITAYGVSGAVIALRRSDAQNIVVEYEV